MTRDAAFVKKVRKILNLNQIELSKEIDISTRQIGNIENGNRPLQKQTKLALECLLRRSNRWESFIKTKPRKPILLLDFDGVIHSYESGWKGGKEIPGPPVHGAFDAIEEYIKFFDVCIHSSRSSMEGGIRAMKKWFIRHGWPEKDREPADIRFPAEKPPAFVGLDDRIITFDGTFPSKKTLMEFKPWHKVEGNR
jgi:transcriptional regulator with XRE-family HTH domain